MVASADNKYPLIVKRHVTAVANSIDTMNKKGNDQGLRACVQIPPQVSFLMGRGVQSQVTILGIVRYEITAMPPEKIRGRTQNTVETKEEHYFGRQFDSNTVIGAYKSKGLPICAVYNDDMPPPPSTAGF